MTHRVVKYLNDPILERPAAPVTDFDTPELHQFVEDMFETMYASHGVGLAAPQVGASKRLVVIDITGREEGTEPEPIVLINPEITAKEGKQTGEEGCLSIPGFREPVTRAKKATVRAQNAMGEWFEVTGEGLLARAFLHEIDHLNGVLFLSYLSTLKRDVIKRKNQEAPESGGVGVMKVIFLGTPEFAVPTLEGILAAGHSISEVVTQPDRPKGRKQELQSSPVKAAALRHDIPVYQPERIRRPEAVEHLRALAPDVMVVVGYGQIIPQSIIDIPRHGIVNVHASLLPELRGAAPIQWSIARGYATTGVTTMRIDAGLDTGDILAKWETAVDPDETAPELSARLATAGADLLVKTLADLERGLAQREPQDNALATLAPILKKEDGQINWRNSAIEIHNLIRGFQPWPGAHTLFRGQSMHLWRSRLGARSWNLAPGTLIDEAGVFAIGGDGAALELLEVQLEGRKRMPAEVFARGHRLTQEEQLGR